MGLDKEAPPQRSFKNLVREVRNFFWLAVVVIMWPRSPGRPGHLSMPQYKLTVWLCSILLILNVSRAFGYSQVLKSEVMSPVVTSSSLLGKARQGLYGILPVFLSASIKMMIRLMELKNLSLFLVISCILSNFPFLIFLTCVYIFQAFPCGRGFCMF